MFCRIIDLQQAILYWLDLITDNACAFIMHVIDIYSPIVHTKDGDFSMSSGTNQKLTGCVERKRHVELLFVVVYGELYIIIIIMYIIDL